MLKGVVLAGRRNRGALAAAAPEAWEALIPIAGRPMGSLVVAALCGVREMDRVVVAGPPELGRGGALVVEPGEDVVGSLGTALAAADLGAEDELIIATGDAPLLTAAAVDEVLAGARRRSLALGYPIVSRAECERQFPGVRRTYARLREGAFTGGNCLYLRAAAVPRTLELLAWVHRHRKHPLRLASLFGFGTLLSVLVGRAGLADVEAAGSRVLRAAAGAVVTRNAGVGVDVDKSEDLDLCRRVLEARVRADSS